MYGVPQQCGNTGAWAPVTRPEQLALTSWNTPVTVPPPFIPPPAPEGKGPVTISLSETNINNEYYGIIEMTIAGLSLGQSVLLEKFRVDNAEGVVNADALLLESQWLTDGVTASMGETFNWNQLYDFGERDGKIEVQMDFWEPSAASIPGEYVYRVSSPLGSFPPAVRRLTVVDEPGQQGFTGTVTANGQPVSDAIVVLLDPLTGYADFLKGVFSDSEGHYDLGAPYQDEFDIVAVKPGYVGPFAVGTSQLLDSGQTLDVDLQLQPGNRKISGTLVTKDTGTPLPGVEITFISLDNDNRFDHRLCTIAWTDNQGRYSVPVTPDRWGAIVRMEAASKIGFLTTSEEPLLVADTRTQDVADTFVRLSKAEAIIWGHIYSEGLIDHWVEAPYGLGGVEVMALNIDSGEAAWTVSDGWGEYRLAVRPGRWQVFPFSFSLEDSQHAGVVDRQLVITGPNQSLRHDFYARPAGGEEYWNEYVSLFEDPFMESIADKFGGELYGFFTDESGNPIGRMRLLAFNTDLDIEEDAIQATYESDGYYNFYLPDGEWLVYPTPEQSAERNLLLKDLPRVVINGSEESVFRDIIAVHPTSTIELTIKDAEDRPLTDMLVHAHASIDGSTYDAFGRSDETGVVRMPALVGSWGLHVKAESAGAHGKRELPHVSIDVTGPVATMTLQAEDYSNMPPTLSLARRRDGAFMFSGSGDSGRYYAIEASRNMIDWYEIGRVRAEHDAFRLVDASITDLQQMYYRVLQK